MPQIKSRKQIGEKKKKKKRKKEKRQGRRQITNGTHKGTFAKTCCGDVMWGQAPTYVRIGRRDSTQAVAFYHSISMLLWGHLRLRSFCPCFMPGEFKPAKFLCKMSRLQNFFPATEHTYFSTRSLFLPGVAGNCLSVPRTVVLWAHRFRYACDLDNYERFQNNTENTKKNLLCK